jgi:hypothetical protein
MGTGARHTRKSRAFRNSNRSRLEVESRGRHQTVDTWLHFCSYTVSPNKQMDYLLCLVLPPIIVALLAPLVVRWIRSGS